MLGSSINIPKADPGFRLYQFTTKKINEYNHLFENDHMKWLDEVLAAAKEQFGSTKEPELLPKTPSVKNKRRRIKTRVSFNPVKIEEATTPPAKKLRAQSKSSATDEDSELDRKRSTKSRKLKSEKSNSGLPVLPKLEPETTTLDGESAQGGIETATACTPQQNEGKRSRRVATKTARQKMMMMVETPPRITRTLRTASRTGTQRTRLGSLKNANKTVEAVVTPGKNVEPENNTDELTNVLDIDKKSNWSPKIELRHMIVNHKVKQLISTHEVIIASSSEDEFRSPKCVQLKKGKKSQAKGVKNKEERLTLHADQERSEQATNSKDISSEPSSKKHCMDKREKDEAAIPVFNISTESHSSTREDPSSDEIADAELSSTKHCTEDKHEAALPVYNISTESHSCTSEGPSSDEIAEPSYTTAAESHHSTSEDPVTDGIVISSHDENITTSDEKSEVTESSSDVAMETASSKSETKEGKTEEDSLELVMDEDSLMEKAPQDSLNEEPLRRMQRSTTRLVHSSVVNNDTGIEQDSLNEEPLRRMQRSSTRSVHSVIAGIEQDSLNEKHLTRQLRSTSTASIKMENNESDAEDKKPRPKRTKQRKVRKVSKRKSSIKRVTRSRSVIEIMSSTTESDGEKADDERSPSRKIRRSDPDKVEVVVCGSNSTMDLFEDSLEANEDHDVPESNQASAFVASSEDHDSDRVEVTPPKRPRLREDASENESPYGNGAYAAPTTDYDTPSSVRGSSARKYRHPASFLNALARKRNDSGSYPTNHNNVITSFIKRNTPVKSKSIKERQIEIRQQIQSKQRKDEDIRKRQASERKQRLEEQRRKREERVKRAAETRERRLLAQREKAQKMEEKYEQKQALTEKAKEEKKKEEIIKKKIFNKKKAEADARRKQEEEDRLQKFLEQEEEQRRHQEILLRKKEFEEQERSRKLDEAKKKHEQRLAELEKEREKEIQLKREQDLEKERERQRMKEERERKREEEKRRREEERRQQMERERQVREDEERQRPRQEREDHEERERNRLKANILSHNTSKNTPMNTTVTMECESYEITPKRVYKPASEDNYDISDLRSDDDTDDDEEPRKKIPKWASGAALKAALINQACRPPDLLELFGEEIDSPDLNALFTMKRSRFNKRTSSAVWDSPLIKSN